MAQPLVARLPSEPLPSRRGEIIGASVPLLILPTVAVALRLLSRWMSRASFWWDDLTIVLSCFLCWAPIIGNLVALHYGFGQHSNVLGEHWSSRAFEFLYISEFLYTIAISSVKFSIIFFMYRIFPIVQFRRLLLWCHLFVVCLTVSCVFVSIFQCTPIHDFWDTLSGSLAPQKGGKCINKLLYIMIVSSINTATNFVLLALPIPILWHLRTSQQQKFVLTAIFTVGITVCAVSITHVIMLKKYDSHDDITWYYVPILIWDSAEPSIAVVSACLPSLRPLFVLVVRGRMHRPKATSPRYAANSLLKPSFGDGFFNRLPEPSDRPGSDESPWKTNHNASAYGGGQSGDEDGDDVELGDQGHVETPINRIRAKTTVVLTISDRVEYQDNLF